VHRSLRPLRIVSWLEPASLATLLINLAFGNAQQVAGLVGPIHGCLYLFAIIATARDPRTNAQITALSVVPGIGGLLALRRLKRIDAGWGDLPPATPSAGTPQPHEPAADAHCDSSHAASSAPSADAARSAHDSTSAADIRR
jgi:hypothetical protein